MVADTTELPVDHVLTLTVETRPAVMIPGGPQGTRGIIAVTGGTFEGSRLRGTVAAGGGDWITIRASGSFKIDVRALLVADDGANILMTYSGVAVPGDPMWIRVAPMFEAPEGPHAWLNDVQAVGRGEIVDGGVRYEVFALR